MNRLSRFVLAGAALAGAAPVVFADYPVAAHRHLADPAAMVHDGRVYVYCSNDDDSPLAGGYEMKSLVCVSSDDLKNWTDHGEVIRVPRDAAWAVHTWAPAVIERNGTFFLYFSNNASGIGVATSPHPAGPFIDPLGRPLIDASTPGVLPAQNLWIFDPAVFIDADGQAYLYFGGNGESNLRIIRLNADMISVDGAAMPVTVPNFFEAAWMHEREGRYYLSYSTVPAAGMRIDYLTADAPTGPFTYGGVVAAQPPSNNNNNHAAQFTLGGSWYHVYHNRFVAIEGGIPPVYRRNLGIESLVYREDGSIAEVAYSRDGVPQAHPLNPFERVEAETFAAQAGVETEPCDEGGMNLTRLAAGDWVLVRGVDFGAGGAAKYTARVASAGTGGEIVLRLDSLTGPVMGTCSVPATGGDQTWTTVSTEITGASGRHDLYLQFAGEGESAFNIDWWQFTPSGPPEIVRAPHDLAIAPGQRATFWVETDGGADVTYQWTHDGVALAGATGAFLDLAAVQPRDAGEYAVVVTNAAGSTTSPVARLSVAVGATAELTNLSVRARVAPADTLIAGFVLDAVEATGASDEEP